MKRAQYRKKVWGAAAAALVFFLTGCAAFQKEKEPPPAPAPAYEPTPQPAPPATKPLPPPEPQPRPPVKTEPKEELFVHEVKWTGESLSIIAGWYTGDIQNWKALTQHNPQIRPALIRMGDRIFIPKGMMKTQEPLPKEFVDAFLTPGQGEQKGGLSGKSPPSQEEPKLFGPKPPPKN